MDKVTAENTNLLVNGIIQEEHELEDDVLQMGCPIEIFTQQNQLFRTVYRSILADLTNIKRKDKGEYIYAGKYPFKCLSDFSLLKEDKKNLQNMETSYNNRILRSIRIALFKKLINAKLITVMQKDEDNDDILNLLIEYEKEHKKFVIDYSKNLIMEKEDYYHLYYTRKIQTLTQSKLYLLMDGYIKKGEPIDEYTMLILGSKLLKDKNFKIGKYSNTGVHISNDFVFNDEDVYSFFDHYLSPMDKEIQEFIKNPQKSTNNITYSKKGKCYFYKQTPFKLIFDLSKSDIKEQFLSKKGSSSCYENSLLVMDFLETSGIDAQLISGKMRKNSYEEIDYSLVETEKNVFDFNRNLVMKKEAFYKMTGFTVINRTDKKLLDENKVLLDSYGIDLGPKTLGYFSQELNQDLVRNKHLLKKKS
ncbi:MAG: hypothetical protein HFJ12_03975 [Bacilli bacterium]|nr:hypothetical protein [Bacilli bacterium]